MRLEHVSDGQAGTLSTHQGAKNLIKTVLPVVISSKVFLVRTTEEFAADCLVYASARIRIGGQILIVSRLSMLQSSRSTAIGALLLVQLER